MARRDREELRRTFAGLDVRIDLQNTLPDSAEMREQIRKAMARAVAALYAEAVKQLSGGARIRRRTGRLIAALEQRVAEGPSGEVLGSLTVNRRMQHIARFLEYGTNPGLDERVYPRGANRALRARAYRRAGGKARAGRLPRALTIGGRGGVLRASARKGRITARRWLRATGEAATPTIVAAFQDGLRDLLGAPAGVITSARARYGAV